LPRHTLTGFNADGVEQQTHIALQRLEVAFQRLQPGFGLR